MRREVAPFIGQESVHARYTAPGFRPGDEPVPAAYERWLGAQAA